MRTNIILLGLVAVCLAGCGTSLGSDPSDPAKGLSSTIATGSATEPKKVADSAAAEQLRQAAGKAVAVNKPETTGYKIGPQDVLQISVFKVPELSKTVQVSENGTINYPLVGETLASGRTPRDLEITLTKSLGAKYLQNPQVSVVVSSYNSQRVTIEGAIKKPGVYPLQGQMSLLQAIATAQGLTDIADDSVVVFREVDGKRTAARFEVSGVREGTGTDPQLRAGDVVVVNTSATKKMLNNVLKVIPIAGVFALL